MARKMKDSGIEWIGEIPEGWRTINPKALFTQRKDKAQKGERQLTSSQQYGILYQDDYMELTGSKVVTVEKDFDILKHVEAGDFVISMRSFQGGLEYSTKSGAISSAYVMLVPNLEFVYPRFYRWLLKSSVYINALQRTTNMVRDGQAMRYSNFAQVRLFTLSIDEQKSRGFAEQAFPEQLPNRRFLKTGVAQRIGRAAVFCHGVLLHAEQFFQGAEQTGFLRPLHRP